MVAAAIWDLRHVTLFLILGALSISQEWLKLELSNFVQRKTISSLAKRMTNHPQKGRGFAHVTHFLYAQLWS